MKLNRKTLRKMILKEINMLNERKTSPRMLGLSSPFGPIGAYATLRQAEGLPGDQKFKFYFHLIEDGNEYTVHVTKIEDYKGTEYREGWFDSLMDTEKTGVPYKVKANFQNAIRDAIQGTGKGKRVGGAGKNAAYAGVSYGV